MTIHRTADQLRTDALAIWHAGVEAVRGDRLVRNNIRVDGPWLLLGDEALLLSDVRRLVVVGAGKAGAGMAAGLEAALGPTLLVEKQVSGWINVPADCLRDLGPIHLHPARPAGLNEPTEAGALGATKILDLVASLGKDDLCVCLLSGGGSALLPAPVAGVSLTEKATVTRLLSAAGANIAELNTVRKQLSRIKGGGLARACRAGRLISLIISDVLGDPLDVIASGPTVADSHTAADALAILERYSLLGEPRLAAAVKYLQQPAALPRQAESPPCQATNIVIGNNAVAVDAAGVEAERRGYSHAMSAATNLEGPAEEIGRHLAAMALRMQSVPGPDCLITGGEPTVKLAPPDVRGRGGRNQQLVLAALDDLLSRGSRLSGIVLLSGGTDGEDGPTDAAGAIIDEHFAARLAAQSSARPLASADYLCRNDAYTFFEPLGGLIKTGPTHTNVCDIRVVVVDRPSSGSSS